MSRLLIQYAPLVLSLLGSVVRLGYGLHHEPWLHAADHLAWGFILEEGSFGYDHLIYYPHEGGTILISLLAKFLGLFTSFNSLALVAILLDFGIRWFQIRTVQKVFDREAAWVFGIWTVVSVPSLIPWGTVNFGLHALSRFFPFLLLHLCTPTVQTAKQGAMVGVVLGLAVWFSYSNIVLIPAFFIYQLFTHRSWRIMGNALAGLAAVLLLHAGVRLITDPGFHLAPFGLMSIRGETLSLDAGTLWDRILHVPQVLVHALSALPAPGNHSGGIKLLYFALFLTAGIALFLAFRKKSFSSAIGLSLLILFFFLASYCLSPFFYDQNTGNYVSFRHISYILPLFTLLLILGVSHWKARHLIWAAFLFLCMGRTIQFFSIPPKASPESVHLATGWALATKLGHQPQQIEAILGRHPELYPHLVQGIGWGLCSASFQHTQSSKGPTETQMQQFSELFFSYSPTYHQDIWQGVTYSFTPNLTPPLDPDLLPELAKVLEAHILLNSSIL